MAVDFATFMSTVRPIIKAGLPILIRGRHGVGKSEVVYMIGRELEREVVERRASQMTEGDLLGLPDSDVIHLGGENPTSRKVTTWNAPDWFATACERPVLLFLDEVDRATLEVRQGLFELTDSRKLNGWHLHPETIIFAAVNGGEHGAQYQVGEMDPAELDRWTVFDVEPSVEDWLTWASSNVNQVLWDFINHNRAHLEHSGDFEPNKVYPSRRSWVRFNKTCNGLNVFEQDGDLNLLFHLATSFVGFEAAVALRDFVQKYEFQVTVEDIVDHGKFEKTTNWGINEHAAMIEKISASGLLNSELTSDQLTNLATWFVGMPPEVAMTLWGVIGKSDSTKTAVGFHSATAHDGTQVREHLVAILGDND